MIYFDTTKAGTAKHRSGLVRVGTRLARELGSAAVGVAWPERNEDMGPADWYLTGELFSEAERPGFTAWLQSRRCRAAAIFHDAIPLKFPHITWPQSVARHPGYMKLLAGFDRVWAVSEASRAELQGFWRWQGLDRVPPVDTLPLGADFADVPRSVARAVPDTGIPVLLCVGILEPRKNQRFLVNVCERLWTEGVAFELHLVGRVNPNFGGPIVAAIRQARSRFPGRVYWHEGADDETVRGLYAKATATVFPTIAEGCGLPLLESLWMGVPCVCSDLPVLRENAAGGGCVPVAVNDGDAWATALRRVLTDRAHVAALVAQAGGRPLPTWADAAARLRSGLSA